VMRLHPEIVARAILSGVEPLNMGYDSPTGVLAAMQRYWKVAEKDLRLAPYVPEGGIEAAAKAVLKRFEAGPVKAEIKNPNGGAPVVVVLGMEDFQRDFNHKAIDGAAWILSLYHEHYEEWAATVAARRHAHSAVLTLIGPLIDSSLGVTPERERELRADPATAFLGRWNWESYIAAKDVWPSPDMGDDFRTPVTTNVPVLFANGDWDTQTPVENTLDIAKSFPKGRVIIAERSGHGALDPIANSAPKVWAEMMNFLRTGVMPDLPARVMVGGPRFAAPHFPAPAAK